MLSVITPKIEPTRSSLLAGAVERLDRVGEGRRGGIVGDRQHLAALLVDRELEGLGEQLGPDPVPGRHAVIGAGPVGEQDVVGDRRRRRGRRRRASGCAMAHRADAERGRGRACQKYCFHVFLHLEAGSRRPSPRRRAWGRAIGARLHAARNVRGGLFRAAPDWRMMAPGRGAMLTPDGLAAATRLRCC